MSDEPGPEPISLDHLDDDTVIAVLGEKARRIAYDYGDYELADDEGFECAACDWRGLSAPMNDDASTDEIVYGGEPMVVCPECGAAATTRDGDPHAYNRAMIPDDLSYREFSDVLDIAEDREIGLARAREIYDARPDDGER